MPSSSDHSAAAASFLSTQFQEVAVTGGRIRYRRMGTGTPLLFVHGVFVNSDLWRNVVPALSEEFDCVVLDLPLGSHSLPMSPDAASAFAQLSRLGVAEASTTAAPSIEARSTAMSRAL